MLDEEQDGNHALGQYMMNAMSLAPKVDSASVEHDFNNHVQDVLTVSYLANTIRTQIDLSNRLATAQLTMGGGEATTENKGDGKGDRRQNRQGGRQNRNEGGALPSL